MRVRGLDEEVREGGEKSHRFETRLPRGVSEDQSEGGEINNEIGASRGKKGHRY